MSLLNQHFDEIWNGFGDLKTKLISKTPFTSIDLRQTRPKGFRLMDFEDRLKKQRGLPHNPGILRPDESEYVAVILLHSNSQKDYEFKIRSDGAIYYNIGFEYTKEPISKWVNIISRFIWSLPSNRQIQRTMEFKRELFERAEKLKLR